MLTMPSKHTPILVQRCIADPRFPTQPTRFAANLGQARFVLIYTNRNLTTINSRSSSDVFLPCFSSETERDNSHATERLIKMHFVQRRKEMGISASSFALVTAAMVYSGGGGWRRRRRRHASRIDWPISLHSSESRLLHPPSTSIRFFSENNNTDCPPPPFDALNKSRELTVLDRPFSCWRVGVAKLLCFVCSSSLRPLFLGDARCVYIIEAA